MKSEMRESLILSWLRHIKECQIVQTNWKPSSKWELKGIEQIEKLTGVDLFMEFVWFCTIVAYGGDMNESIIL